MKEHTVVAPSLEFDRFFVSLPEIRLPTDKQRYEEFLIIQRLIIIS